MPAAAPRPLPTVEPGRTPELSIVVMFTHDDELARGCLASVAAAELPPAEVIAILNAASREVREVVLDEFAGARVIDSPVNTGTAVAWQLGFTAAQAEFVLLMHEDAELLDDTAKRLLDALRAEPTAAAAGPWIDEFGVERHETNAGWARFLGHSLLLNSGQIPQELTSGPYAVNEISSAISLWRRTAWEEIGGFEERTFPAISVEADSFAALWARGHSVLVEPRARGRHMTGAMLSAPTLLSGPHIRHFLGDRFGRLWDEKWADRADWFADPAEFGWTDGPIPQKAIERALALAQKQRVDLPRIADPPRSLQPITNPTGSVPAPTTVTPEIAERLVAAERVVIDDYTRWLIARDVEMTRRYEEAYAAYVEESARSTELRAALERASGNPLRRAAARFTRRS